jgi:ankyrin repeat protein
VNNNTEKIEFIFFYRKMELCCCCCLNDYDSPVILNSGESLCEVCAKKLSTCPTTRFQIIAKIPNGIVKKFLQIPGNFTIADLMDSINKIAYMNQYDTIELHNSSMLIKDGKFLLNSYEFMIFINKCTNIECVNSSNQRRLIHYVCKYGTLNMLQCMISRNADLNCIDIYNWQPIHYACKNDDISLVKYLMEISGNFYYHDAHLIHLLCRRGDEALDAIRYFINHGIDINCINWNGGYPIHFACYVGDKGIKLFDYLMECGADINCVDINDSSYPIHYACMHADKSLEMVKHLVECGANINCVDECNRYPIHLACWYGDHSLQLIRLLVEYGADVNCVDDNHMYPIHYACEGGDAALQLVKLLVEYGADINCISDMGEYPIHFACCVEDDVNAIELVKYLAENGADLNCVDNSMYCPIHVACKFDALNIFKFLISNGVKIPPDLSMHGKILNYYRQLTQQ